MKKQKTNKVKTVVYLIHFILIDIWARNGVLHIFWGQPTTKSGHMTRPVWVAFDTFVQEIRSTKS